MMFFVVMILSSFLLLYNNSCSLVVALASSSKSSSKNVGGITTNGRSNDDDTMPSKKIGHQPNRFGITVAKTEQTTRPIHLSQQKQRRQRQRPIQSLQIPKRKLSPPYPNGRCDGTIITIPPEDTYGSFVVNLGVGDLILPPRPIQVWLPPGYDDEDNNNNNNSVSGHPVLYVHDGQNCYEDTQSWTGASWRLIGALTRLADHRLIHPRLSTTSDTTDNNMNNHNNLPLPIVVMIPSADGDLLPGIKRRHLEYGDSSIPFAQLHVDFIATKLKPYVDTNFNTNPNPTHTYTIGSSLGGQASLHLLLKYPNLFGGAACLSPAFGPSILNDVNQAKFTGILKSKKIYLDIGGDHNDIKVPFFDPFDHLTREHWWNPGYFWLDTQLKVGVDTMKNLLNTIDDVDCCYYHIPGGRHNERAWAQRIDKPLKYLFS